ncbi:hypothetical protein EMPG_09408 [Blastomyces silverae]|uniref:Uncharacterized protein n=1 Tax=Blastomyces silverae TaxID=2060906 RepID=A0A0H1BPB5_9EURO|nr:hypothetical protein EMPG_09408 [Blastomyces silverae]
MSDLLEQALYELKQLTFVHLHVEHSLCCYDRSPFRKIELCYIDREVKVNLSVISTLKYLLLRSDDFMRETESTEEFTLTAEKFLKLTCFELNCLQIVKIDKFLSESMKTLIRLSIESCCVKDLKFLNITAVYAEEVKILLKDTNTFIDFYEITMSVMKTLEISDSLSQRERIIANSRSLTLEFMVFYLQNASTMHMNV